MYTCKISCLLVFRLYQPEEEEEEEELTPVLQGFADFFSISLVFSMFFTLALVGVKLNGI